MDHGFDDIAWQLLIDRIDADKCTPFLGAGMSAGAIPLGAEIAREWAEKYGYPLADNSNLSSVAQFLAVQYDPGFPAERLAEKIIGHAKRPNFSAVDEPHRVLAELPLSVYVTTNYDCFMSRALESRRLSDPRREICRWYSHLDNIPSVFKREKGYHPTPANPLVFHLHGSDQYSESMVLTEDDYLRFLANFSAKRPKILPLPVRHALAENSLLFIGYSLQDWTFRILMLSLRMFGRLSFAVLLPPDDGMKERHKVQAYLEKYYESTTQLQLRYLLGKGV